MRQPVIRRFALPDPAATADLGRRLVEMLPDNPAGWTILLQGPLGAGKTTLARAMLEAFGHEGSTPSPTYTLVEPYAFPEFTVYHIDLYRIVDDAELEFLGWADLDEGLRLVEWPERVANLRRVADIQVTLDLAAGNGRLAAIEPISARAAAVLEGNPPLKL